MITLLEIAYRARNGPKVNEKEWNLSLFKKMNELTKRYNLKCLSSEEPFMVDNEVADSAFQAAIDFLVEMGVYCVSSSRVIKFTEEEVREAVRKIPKEVTVGEGKDARIIRKREVEDKRPVNVIVGGHGPWSEELFPLPLMVSAFAQIPRVDIIEGFNFATLDGFKLDEEAMAAYAAKRAMKLMREGVKKAGREGMAITYYPIHTRTSTLIAPIDPDYGLRRTDGILLSILPDIKVEENFITASIVYEDYGSYRVNGGAFGNIGGFCGGVEGAIIEAIAKALAAWIIYRDCIQYAGEVISLLEPRTIETTRVNKEIKEIFDVILPNYIVNKAINKNTNIILFGELYLWNVVKSAYDDLCTEDNLLGHALSSIVNTVIGKNLVYTETPPPSLIDWNIKVSDATIKGGIKLNDLKEIIKRVVQERLKGKLVKGRIDRRMLVYSNPRAFIEPLQRCYDFMQQKTSGRYIESEAKVESYLEGLGLKFNT